MKTQPNIEPSPDCDSGNVVFVQHRPDDALLQKVGLAATCFGLGLTAIESESADVNSLSLRQLRQLDTVAAIIDASALCTLGKYAVFDSLRRPNSNSVPLLIVGITPHTTQLDSWSDGAIRGCFSISPRSVSDTYLVGQRNEVTGQLAGQSFASGSTPAGALAPVDSRTAVPLIGFRSEEVERHVFVWVRLESKAEVFFLVQMDRTEQPGSLSKMRVASLFCPAAPFMMFLRHAAGEHGWHTAGSFANFTIDDPWLTQPFGFLDYRALLAEMDSCNFHTTIAFIPWNFDRSEPEVVDLFKAHRNRFSLCFHGNNHKRQEFADYRRVPIKTHIDNIRQAVARMSRLQDFTGLVCDHIMVFPHEIAPEPTLAILKECNFLATANSNNVPLHAPGPTDDAFYLRPVTTRFANFASMLRYSAELPMPQLELAVNAFLGNPLLFYGHERMFSSGLDAFNPIAELVNRIEPSTQWTNLGNIAEHQFLLRKRYDSDYDIWIFSRSTILTNPHNTGVRFRVFKPESCMPPIRSITIDDHEVPFFLDGGVLRLDVNMMSNESKRLDIHYHTRECLKPDRWGKADPHAAIIRGISDFRDITLSQFRVGRFVKRLY